MKAKELVLEITAFVSSTLQMFSGVTRQDDT